MTFSALGSSWALHGRGLSWRTAKHLIYFPLQVPKTPYLSVWCRTFCLPVRHTPRAAFSESCAKSITPHLQSLPSFFPFKTPLFQCPEKTRVFPAWWEELESHIARAWIPGYWGHFYNLQQVTVYRFPHAPGHPRSPAAEKCCCEKESRAPLSNILLSIKKCSWMSAIFQLK